MFLAITALCFVFLYLRLNGAAAREGLTLVDYMTRVFSHVAWVPWLVLMLAYSCFYFLVDTRVTTSALNWFLDKHIRYRDILPIRASAYIISIFSEQIGKGAMAYYLNRRHGVPGWEVGSVMLFIMFCEVFYLMAWAAIGFAFSRARLPEAFGLIPWLALGGAVVLAVWIAYFRGTIFPGSGLRDKRILHAFRVARPWHYAAFLLLRSPALLGAGVVYTIALQLFGVPVSFLTLFPYLPGDLLRGDGADADARCRDHVVGPAVPGQRRTDGGVRLRAAQLLRALQRPARVGLLAAREAGAAGELMAHLLTGVRLLAVVPAAWAFSRPDGVSAWLLVALMSVAIATDYSTARWRAAAARPRPAACSSTTRPTACSSLPGSPARRWRVWFRPCCRCWSSWRSASTCWTRTSCTARGSSA